MVVLLYKPKQVNLPPVQVDRIRSELRDLGYIPDEHFVFYSQRKIWERTEDTYSLTNTHVFFAVHRKIEENMRNAVEIIAKGTEFPVSAKTDKFVSYKTEDGIFSITSINEDNGISCNPVILGPPGLRIPDNVNWEFRAKLVRISSELPLEQARQELIQVLKVVKENDATLQGKEK